MKSMFAWRKCGGYIWGPISLLCLVQKWVLSCDAGYAEYRVCQLGHGGALASGIEVRSVLREALCRVILVKCLLAL